MAPTILNLAAISVKPSSLAVSAKPAYMEVHSSFSPAAAASRLSRVPGTSPPCRYLNQILACSRSLPEVSVKMLEIWT